jgi:hypothetical protein
LWKAYASVSYKGNEDEEDEEVLLKKFRVGLNIAALDNEYGHDLGYNQFSGRQFWDDSWQNYDLQNLTLMLQNLILGLIGSTITCRKQCQNITEF